MESYLCYQLKKKGEHFYIEQLFIYKNTPISIIDIFLIIAIPNSDLATYYVDSLLHNKIFINKIELNIFLETLQYKYVIFKKEKFRNDSYITVYCDDLILYKKIKYFYIIDTDFTQIPKNISQFFNIYLINGS